MDSGPRPLRRDHQELQVRRGDLLRRYRGLRSWRPVVGGGKSAAGAEDVWCLASEGLLELYSMK